MHHATDELFVRAAQLHRVAILKPVADERLVPSRDLHLLLGAAGEADREPQGVLADPDDPSDPLGGLLTVDYVVADLKSGFERRHSRKPSLPGREVTKKGPLPYGVVGLGRPIRRARHLAGASRAPPREMPRRPKWSV